MNKDGIMSTPQWIPCDERLPEKDGDYLVSLVNCHVKIFGYTTKNKDKFSKGFYLLTSDLFALPPVDPVIAWMPLPKPYEGERKDDETDRR